MSEIEMRELDAFIAEHVMGWRRHQFALQDGQIGFFKFSHGAVEVRTDGKLFNFNPTTDPAAAMLVLEKCRRHTEQLYHDEQYFSVRIDLEADESCIYLLNQKYMECRHIQRFEGVEELPTAICLFAKQLFSK